jgi:hypothetical protein
LVHGIGLAFLAVIAKSLAEAAIWPTLARRPYRLEYIDTHLHAIRGSVPSIFRALVHTRDQFAFVTLACIAVVAVLSQLDRVLMGQAFAIHNGTTTYKSGYHSGGGIGLPIFQAQHNGHIPGPATYASSYYTSWSNNLSTEPLPELRDFIVDRYNLSAIGGDFTISGLKAEKTISCSSRPLTILGESEGVFNATASDTSSSVTLRIQSRLSCWMDAREFQSPTSTVVTLIFAAINGTIEGGASTQPTDTMIEDNYTEISSVACTVAVNLVQATVALGSDSPNVIANVSSTSNVVGPQTHEPLNKKGGGLGEVAAWLGGSVAALGASVYGAQPMFQAQGQPNQTLLPTTYTTTELSLSPSDNNDWTLATIEQFINVSSGALALAISKQWATETTTVYSNLPVPSLSTGRSYLLLAPAAVMVVLILTLLVLDGCIHRITRTPRMREMGLVEWTDSMLNENLLGGVQAHGKNVKMINVGYSRMSKDVWING